MEEKRLASYINCDMAHYSCVVGQSDVLCLMATRRSAAAVGSCGRRRVLVDDEGTLDVNPDGAWVAQRLVDHGGVGGSGTRATGV